MTRHTLKKAIATALISSFFVLAVPAMAEGEKAFSKNEGLRNSLMALVEWVDSSLKQLFPGEKEHSEDSQRIRRARDDRGDSANRSCVNGEIHGCGD